MWGGCVGCGRVGHPPHAFGCVSRLPRLSVELWEGLRLCVSYAEAVCRAVGGTQGVKARQASTGCTEQSIALSCALTSLGADEHSPCSLASPPWKMSARLAERSRRVAPGTGWECEATPCTQQAGITDAPAGDERVRTQCVTHSRSSRLLSFRVSQRSVTLTLCSWR